MTSAGCVDAGVKVTRCAWAIESGVDIPTVSRWLGHKDGGALGMRVYGHLRNEHSVAARRAGKMAAAATPNFN